MVTSVLPISVVIVARNEAQNLPRCLASVQGWVAEIVVGLNNTTDESATIAAQHGARVEQLPWQGYRDTKNSALGLASHDWTLSLDADEAVSPALREAIAGFFARGDHTRYAGVQFPRKVWFINRWINHGDWYPDLSLRLFDRNQARWGGDAFVHEKVQCDGPIATLPADLLHFPYPTIGAQHVKLVEYARLSAARAVDRSQDWSAMPTVVRPLWRFIRAYVFRRGFLDGFPGLVAAVSIAYYTFLRYACHYERTHQSGP